MAASIVQRPSPESCTKPVYSIKCRILGQRHGGQIEQPGTDHAAAPPDFGDVGEVQVVLLIFGKFGLFALRKISKPSA